MTDHEYDDAPRRRPTDDQDKRSPLLPRDEFDVLLKELSGHPDGATTAPTLVAFVDDYGKTRRYTVQTVKWAKGTTVFVEATSSDRHDRYVLPPQVIRAILRQQDTATSIVRRRHGRRLAEDRKAAGVVPTFTPEARRKALATRRARAKARRARKARKAGNQ
jgi:hypothetical protein